VEIRTRKNTKTDDLLNSIKAMGAEYIYVADINSAPCVRRKKQEIQDKLKNVGINEIIISNKGNRKLVPCWVRS